MRKLIKEIRPEIHNLIQTHAYEMVYNPDEDLPEYMHFVPGVFCYGLSETVEQWIEATSPGPEIVRMDVGCLTDAPDPTTSFEPGDGGRKAVHAFLQKVACLLGKDPKSVPPLVRRYRKIRLPGVEARLLKESVLIDFDPKTFSWIAEKCGVKQGF